MYPYLDKKSIEKVISLLPLKIENYYDLFFSNSNLLNFLTEKKAINQRTYLNCQSEDLNVFWNYYLKKDEKFTSYIFNLNQLLGNSALGITELNQSLPSLIKYLNDEKNIASLTNFLDEITSIFTYRNTIFLEKLKLNIDSINQNIDFNVMNSIAKWQKQESSGVIKQKIVQDINTAIKKAIYKEIRTYYNQAQTTKSQQLSVMCYYLQVACYPYKYRYNPTGDFIVPYGGAAYDDLRFDSQLAYLKSNTGSFKGNIGFKNYAEYLKGIDEKVSADDFILAIPPVKTDVLSYNKLAFKKDDEIKLFNILKTKKCKFLLVLNKSEFTDSIKEKSNLEVVAIRSRYPFISKDQRANKEYKVIIKNY